MHIQVADITAQVTREQAVHDARNDLWELRKRAVESGRDRSREIAKTTRIDTRTGELRYNPAGRLLRDWYFHVYLNTLRANLGEPAIAIDAQQVEDTTGILRRLRDAHGVAALKVVAVIRDTAADDAAHAAADIVDHLTTVAARRAILHAPDDRFDGNPLAIHVTRHWYQHCYNDHLYGATRTRHPLADVTDGQQHEVARTLASGQARRIIGDDGIPLVTAQGTTLTQRDRDLAAGLAGLISPITDPGHHTDPNLPLSGRVTRTWAELGHDERAQWLQTAGTHHMSADTGWSALPGDIQAKIIRLYLDTHQADQVPALFQGARIDGDPGQVAATMFNHPHLLKTSSLAAGTTTDPAFRLDGVDDIKVDTTDAQTTGRSLAT